MQLHLFRPSFPFWLINSMQRSQPLYAVIAISKLRRTQGKDFTLTESDVFADGNFMLSVPLQQRQACSTSCLISMLSGRSPSGRNILRGLLALSPLSFPPSLPCYQLPSGVRTSCRCMKTIPICRIPRTVTSWFSRRAIVVFSHTFLATSSMRSRWRAIHCHLRSL